MFIQLSRMANSFGDVEPVYVNPNLVEHFYPTTDMFGGKEIAVTKVIFNQGTLVVKEDVGTIQSYIISALRG